MKVSRLAERTDEILPRVLQAGGEVVEAKVRTNLQSVIGSGIKEESRSTGELVGALAYPLRSRTGTGISMSRSAFPSRAWMVKPTL